MADARAEAAALPDQQRYFRPFKTSMRITSFPCMVVTRLAAVVRITRINARPVLRLWAYRLAIALSLIALPHAALAYDWEVTAHVTTVEGSYVPAEVVFIIDQGAGTCVAGASLAFSGNPSSNNLPANVQAVYAGLLAALQTGSRITIFGDNAGCTIDYIHFLSN